MTGEYEHCVYACVHAGDVFFPCMCARAATNGLQVSLRHHGRRRWLHIAREGEGEYGINDPGP